MPSSKTAEAIGAKRLDVFTFDPDDLVLITDKKHPRYDERAERAFDEATVLTILLVGVIQNCVGVKNGNAVEIVAGQGRVINAREAKRRQLALGVSPTVRVPVVLTRGDDKNLFLKKVIENAHREDPTTLQRAYEMQRLLDLGASDDEAATALKCTSKTIENYKKLLQCAPEVQKAVGAGTLIATAARELYALPREEQVKRLAEMTETGATKGAKATRAAKRAKAGKVVAAPERPRGFIAHWCTALEAQTENRELNPAGRAAARVALVTIAFINGDDGALDDCPTLREAADAVRRS